MKGYRGKVMKKWLFLACLLILPHTLWVVEAAQEGGEKPKNMVSPLLAVTDGDEDSDESGTFSPRTSRSMLSPMSPPVAGCAVRKTSDHKCPAKYSEDRYELVGYYQREDWTYAPLYRLKDPKK